MSFWICCGGDSSFLFSKDVGLFFSKWRYLKKGVCYHSIPGSECLNHVSQSAQRLSLYPAIYRQYTEMMPGLQFWVAVASFFNITGPSAGAFVLQAECSTGDVRTLPAERNVNRQMTTESTIYSTKAQTRMAFCVSAVTAPARGEKCLF